MKTQEQKVLPQVGSTKALCQCHHLITQELLLSSLESAQLPALPQPPFPDPQEPDSSDWISSRTFLSAQLKKHITWRNMILLGTGCTVSRTTCAPGGPKALDLVAASCAGCNVSLIRIRDMSKGICQESYGGNLGFYFYFAFMSYL